MARERRDEEVTQNDIGLGEHKVMVMELITSFVLQDLTLIQNYWTPT